MSYEGSIQYLCASGHVVTFDCYNAPSTDEFRCCYCGAPAVDENHIDETNGSHREWYWPHGLSKVKDAEKCECCGSITKPATYRLATKEERGEDK